MEHQKVMGTETKLDHSDMQQNLPTVVVALIFHNQYQAAIAKEGCWMRNLLKTSVLLCDELLVYETDFFALITLTKLIFAMISFQYTPSRVSARFFIVVCKNITFFTALQSIKMYFYHPHIFLTNISTEDNTASLIFEINTLPLLFQ